MKALNTFWFFMIILFVIFITVYISQATGYYDYQQHRQVELTNDKIKQFEEDVKEGKVINVKNYLDDSAKTYHNGISKLGLRFSKTVSASAKKGLNKVFKFLEVLLKD